MKTCDLDASGSPGMASYWKFVYLIVYSLGPFLATFLINIAIIVSIYRARRLQSQFGVFPRVRFFTNQNSSEKESANAVDEARGLALVELRAHNSPENNEIPLHFSDRLASVEAHQIKDGAISMRKGPRNHKSKGHILNINRSKLIQINIY